MELTESLHRALQQCANDVASSYGDRVRTWSESVERVARLAGALRAVGIRAGDRVGILALNSDRYHESLLAVTWAGGVFVPVNTRWSAEEISFSLVDAHVRVLFVDEHFAELVPLLWAQVPSLEQVIDMADGGSSGSGLAMEHLVSSTEPAQDAHRGGDDLAAIYYTGGTTGRPKGVMLTHNNLLTSALGSMASGNYVQPGTRYLHAGPMFHGADASGWVCVNILGGAHFFVPRFVPAEVIDTIARYRVTDTVIVPTMVQMLVDAPEAGTADLSSLRRIIYGGSPIAEAVIARVLERLPNVRLTQVYGMTEMSPVMTMLGHEQHRDSRLRQSAGRAAPHVRLRVVDEHDVDVPVGTVGQILVRGDGQTVGYWNRDEETRDALAGGWMHTGDSGYLDEDGYLFLVDRVKDMIISGGENIYSTEVENVLQAHPSVASCAVIGVPDDHWGERVHAVVVLVAGAEATEDELREFVRSRIAHYKAPRTVEFVDSMPLSGAGKILKRELRARYLAEQQPSIVGH